jgi:hypothetical protein
MNTIMKPEDIRPIVHLLNWIVRQFYVDVRGWINRALDLRESRVLARQEKAVAEAATKAFWFGIGLAGLAALLVLCFLATTQQQRA